MSIRKRLVSGGIAIAMTFTSLLGAFPVSAATKDAASNLDLEKDGINNESDIYFKLGNFDGDNGYIPFERIGMDEELTIASESMPSIPAAYQNSVSQLAAYPATRDQHPYNTCWAFSAAAMAEFNLIKKGICNSTVDLSEAHLAYYAFNRGSDVLGGLDADSNGLFSGKSYLDFGGNSFIAARTLANWKGMALESSFPYGNAGAYISGAMDANMAMTNNVAKLKNASCFNMRPTDGLASLDVAKSYIINNGAIGVAYCSDLTTNVLNSIVEDSNNDPNKTAAQKQSYANIAQMLNCEKDNVPYGSEYVTTYYVPESLQELAKETISWDLSANHAVTVVGWDDNFPASNFAKTPKYNGAWLVRNSWSTLTTNSMDSYFWLSYYDVSLDDTGWSFEMAAASDYDHNYQYDGGNFVLPYTSTGIESVGDVYTAVSDEILKAVQLSSLYYANESYVINIYKNLKNDSNPSSGELAATQNFTAGSCGIYTVDLSTPLVIEKGEKFSIVITTKSKNYDIESDMNTKNDREGYVNDVAASGHSFLKHSGNWYSSAYCKSTSGKEQCNNNSEFMFGDFCIKALTKAASPMEIANASKGVEIKWDAMAGANAYNVYRVVNNEVSLLATTFDCSYLDKAAKNGEKYSYYIVGDNGASTLTKSTTYLSVPGWKSLKSPRKKALTVSYKKNSKASGYEIQYSTKKSFKGAKTSRMKKNSRVSKTLTGLKSKKKYYVRIRAYKGSEYSAWSSVKTKKVK